MINNARVACLNFTNRHCHSPTEELCMVGGLAPIQPWQSEDHSHEHANHLGEKDPLYILISVVENVWWHVPISKVVKILDDLTPLDISIQRTTFIHPLFIPCLDYSGYTPCPVA